MSEMRIEFNSDGIRDLLHIVGATVCAEHANRTAEACGEGYKSEMYDAGSRTIASVYTYDEDPDEILRNLQ